MRWKQGVEAGRPLGSSGLICRGVGVAQAGGGGQGGAKGREVVEREALEL